MKSACCHGIVNWKHHHLPSLIWNAICVPYHLLCMANAFWSFLFVLSEYILAYSTSLLVGFDFMWKPTWTKSQAVNSNCLGLKPGCILWACVPKDVIEPLSTLVNCSGKWQGRAIPHRVTLGQRKYMSLDTLVPTCKKVLLVRQIWVVSCDVWEQRVPVIVNNQTRVLVLTLSFSFLIHYSVLMPAGWGEPQTK